VNEIFIILSFLLYFDFLKKIFIMEQHKRIKLLKEIKELLQLQEEKNIFDDESILLIKNLLKKTLKSLNK
jgi:hypothetical protein